MKISVPRGAAQRNSRRAQGVAGEQPQKSEIPVDIGRDKNGVPAPSGPNMVISNRSWKCLKVG
jgi:hypothetical protein